MIEQRYVPKFLFGAEAAGEPDGAHSGRTNRQVCPVCWQADATVKATAIARSGRGRLVLEDGSSAIFQSELAGMLSEPEPPKPMRGSAVLKAFAAGWLLLALDLAIVAGLRAQDWVAVPAASLGAATWLGVAWFGFLIPGSAILRYFMSRDQTEKEEPRWRYAIERWREMQYCSRDDVVFVPGDHRSVAPEHSSLLLVPLAAANGNGLKASGAHAHNSAHADIVQPRKARPASKVESA